MRTTHFETAQRFQLLASLRRAGSSRTERFRDLAPLGCLGGKKEETGTHLTVPLWTTCEVHHVVEHVGLARMVASHELAGRPADAGKAGQDGPAAQDSAARRWRRLRAACSQGGAVRWFHESGLARQRPARSCCWHPHALPSVAHRLYRARRPRQREATAVLVTLRARHAPRQSRQAEKRDC